MLDADNYELEIKNLEVRSSKLVILTASLQTSHYLFLISYCLSCYPVKTQIHITVTSSFNENHLPRFGLRVGLDLVIVGAAGQIA